MKIDLRNFKNWLLKNLGFKILSFVAAVALWSGFLGRGEFILDLEMGLNYLVPTHLTLRGAPDYVKVRLKGPEMAMKKFSRKSRNITIDLLGKSIGLQKVKVTRELFELPPGVQVISIRPEILHLELIEGEPHGN